MIGYILLIALGMVMAVMVYAYIKTYVPSDPLKCPDETSLLLKDYSCSSTQLNATIKNNGNFNVEGMIIVASTDVNQEVATHDLTQYLNVDLGDGSSAITDIGNYIVFSLDGEENLKPNEEISYFFDLNESLSYYNVEIIPIRFEKKGTSTRYSICSEGGLKEVLDC